MTMRDKLLSRGIPPEALKTLPKVAAWGWITPEFGHTRMMKFVGGIKDVLPEGWYECWHDPTVGIDIPMHTGDERCGSTCFTTCRTGTRYVTREEAEALEREQG